MSKTIEGLDFQFDFLFHHPNPWIDDMLHGDHTHTDDDGNEVTSPGTPDRPVVIDPEPEPDPNPNPAPNPNPGPAPDTQQAGDGMVEPLTNAKLDALTKPGGVPTGGVFRGGAADEFIFDSEHIFDPPQYGQRTHAYGNATGDDQLYGGEGNDVLVGGYGNDYLNGGPGNDYLFSGQLYVYNNRTPHGAKEGIGGNILMGGPGNDYLESGGESDILNGGPGNDHLVSDWSDFVAMIGGPGRDVFDVTRNDGQVKILDFQDGVDKIRFTVGDGASGTAHLNLYQVAMRAGVQWDMAWLATEVDNGVTLPINRGSDTTGDHQLTIEGAYLHNLQFEIIDGDLYIV